MVASVYNGVLAEGSHTQRTPEYKTARKASKPVSELKKLRRKRAWLITAIFLLPFAILLGLLFTWTSIALVAEGTVPSVNALTFVFGLPTLFCIFLLVLSIRALIKVSKAIRKEKKRMKQGALPHE